MSRETAQISKVIYNPANRCFEALVTLHLGTTRARYATRLRAPIDTPFAEASRGLIAHAIRQAERGMGMRATFRPLRPQAQPAELPHAA
ncbi:hypothetical protein [Mesobacterium pallidum]|uniref:hypothetical protein n=1 Tax=Mesobacterium pallidum TaxID=2872037 RepID=UPI001EE30483|nr:hypothetical protein [Mesobacterium pallidum]